MLRCHRHPNNCAHTQPRPQPRTNKHTYIYTHPHPTSDCLPASYDPPPPSRVMWLLHLWTTVRNCSTHRQQCGIRDASHLQCAGAPWVTVWRKCKAGWDHHLLHHHHHCRGGGTAGEGGEVKQNGIPCCLWVMCMYFYVLSISCPSGLMRSDVWLFACAGIWNDARLAALCISALSRQQVLSTPTDSDT